MIVYIVRKINDYEYGCRNIEAVFEHEEDAKKYIHNTGNQFLYEFWNGSKEWQYIIEEYNVQ